MRTTSVSIQKVDFQKKNSEEHDDFVAVEEPLEIRLGFGPTHQRQQQSISITMRTPGHDFELAVGFLLTEGIIENAQSIAHIDHCGPPAGNFHNIIRIDLSADVPFDFTRLKRHFYTTSSCGVCGKTSIEALRTNNKYINQPALTPSLCFDFASIHRLPEKLLASQPTFGQTGGLHAAALVSSNPVQLRFVREDVGRHNAVDKVIGAALMENLLPLSDYLLFVSGRASFELMQKSAMAGIPFLAAVGAPSSLAVELAKDLDMTLVGFVRNQRFNIYHGAWRIQ